MSLFYTPFLEQEIYLSQKVFSGLLCTGASWRKESYPEKSVTCCRPSELHSQKGSQPIKHKANRNGKVAFPSLPVKGFVPSQTSCVCVIPGQACVMGQEGVYAPGPYALKSTKGKLPHNRGSFFVETTKQKGVLGPAAPSIGGVEGVVSSNPPACSYLSHLHAFV